jgi:hypothetical protein
MRFSMIEMKTFMYILLSSFIFLESGDKIIKANVYVTSYHHIQHFAHQLLLIEFSHVRMLRENLRRVANVRCV